MPSMNATFVDAIDAKGTPGVVHHEHVGLGLAVDVQKADGTRTLMVPVIADADTLDFHSFILAYEDKVRRVLGGNPSADDFAGATVSITNPGTLGTVQSVPRLMPGQGAIFGVGSLELAPGLRGRRSAGARRPRGRQGPDAHIDLRPPDHPGRRVRPVPAPRGECLTGGHGFYDEIFSDLGVPYEPSRWSTD